MDGFSLKTTFDYFCENLSRKSTFHSTETNITGTLHEDDCTFVIYLAQFFLQRKMIQTKVVEKTKTHILCPIMFLSENRAVYGIMWKNKAKSDRPEITIWQPTMAHAQGMMDNKAYLLHGAESFLRS